MLRPCKAGRARFPNAVGKDHLLAGALKAALAALHHRPAEALASARAARDGLATSRRNRPPIRIAFLDALAEGGQRVARDLASALLAAVGGHTSRCEPGTRVEDVAGCGQAAWAGIAKFHRLSPVARNGQYGRRSDRGHPSIEGRDETLRDYLVHHGVSFVPSGLDQDEEVATKS